LKVTSRQKVTVAKKFQIGVASLKCQQKQNSRKTIVLQIKLVVSRLNKAKYGENQVQDAGL
jgi:hypothetical protein